jgi:hypothetical protein
MAIWEDFMRVSKLHLVVILLFCIGMPAAAQKNGTTVTGKLIRVVGIGGESTGWAIQFDSEKTIDGKKLHSIEIDYSQSKELLALENKMVKASGKITHVEGVETGDRTVLKVSSIKQVNSGA